MNYKVCDEALTCVRPHEQGQLVTVASRNGIIYLLELSEALKINHKNDKLLLTAVKYIFILKIDFQIILLHINLFIYFFVAIG